MMEGWQKAEYTGQNRCIPCTIINSVLAIGMSLFAGVILLTEFSFEISMAYVLLMLLVSALLIWLRGYLVPGTPELTKRYLPRQVLSWFGKNVNSLDMATTGLSTTQIKRILITEEIIEVCKDIDDLCLHTSVKDEWESNIEKFEGNNGKKDLIEVLEIESKKSTVIEAGDGYLLVQDEQEIGSWPSTAAVTVDIASAHLLRKSLSSWGNLPPAARCDLLSILRIFVDSCPDGEGIEYNQEEVETCCSSVDIISLTCEKSGKQIFERPIKVE